MEETETIQLHKYTEYEIENGLLIIGAPTLGNIANITTSFLIKNLGLNLIGAFSSDKFPPATVIQDGVPFPPVRIYAGKHVCGPDGSCDQIVIISSVFPLDKEILPILADRILEFARNNNIEIITTIEGVNKEGMDLGSQAKVFHVATNEKAKKDLDGLSSETLENGMVSGLSGVLLTKGSIQSYPITALLAEAHKNFPDSRSAAAVLQVLNKMVPEIEMDPEPLLEQAEEIEEEIGKAMSQIRKAGETNSVGQVTQGFYA